MYKTIKSIHLNIADFNIALHFKELQSSNLHKLIINNINTYYKSFIVSKLKKEDFRIIFVDKRIVYLLPHKDGKQYYINFLNYRNDNTVVTFYSIGFEQFQFIIRHILTKLLATNNGLYLHSSANLTNRKAILFVGKSKKGKSTITKILNSNYPSLADDSAFIKLEKKSSYFYQTPFIEKQDWIQKNQRKYPIKAVFFLKRGKRSYMKIISNKTQIIKQTTAHLYTEKDYLPAQLKTVAQFVNQNCEFYNLALNKPTDVNQIIKF